jgi:hypothetical protein
MTLETKTYIGYSREHNRFPAPALDPLLLHGPLLQPYHICLSIIRGVVIYNLSVQ